MHSLSCAQLNVLQMLHWLICKIINWYCQSTGTKFGSSESVNLILKQVFATRLICNQGLSQRPVQASTPLLDGCASIGLLNYIPFFMENHYHFWVRKSRSWFLECAGQVVLESSPGWSCESLAKTCLELSFRISYFFLWLNHSYKMLQIIHL